jgi:hypothetical protein
MENLFKQLGYQIKDMKIGELYDVSSYDKYLKSYDISTNQIVKSKILGIIKKEETVEYKVFEIKNAGLINNFLFSGSKDHRIFAKKDTENKYNWISLDKIEQNINDTLRMNGILMSYQVINSQGKASNIFVTKTNNIIPIVDMQMENGCYFSEGILSHNSGGNALKFYASQRLEIIRTGNLKVGDQIIGNTTKVKVVKNKVAPPKKEAEFNIIFGKGIDTDSEIIILAKEDGIIKQSGAWFKYGEDNIAQGLPNAIMWLNENPDKKKEILDTILANRGLE